VKNLLSDEEVENRIRQFLIKHDYNFKEKVFIQKKLKLVDFSVVKKDNSIAIMLFLWRRSIPYNKVYYLEDYLEKYGFSKVILVCRQISPRAKEIIKKEKIPIEIIFESDFRIMNTNPLMGKI
jgi:hypothetical protein